MTDSYEDYLKKSKAYYDRRFGQVADDAYAPHQEEVLRWNHIRRAVRRMAPRQGKPAILDFGCGRGWMSGLLAEFGSVTGVDLSPDAIELAKSRHPGIEFVCVDAADDVGKVLARTFDIVVSSEVIEHVLKQEEYMRNVIALLKPGGALVLTTPNGRWKSHFYHGGRSSWAQPYELWLTAPELVGLAGGMLDNAAVRSFNAGWVLDLPSFGWPHLLGNRVIRLLARVTGLKPAYLRWLENHGYGINLLLEGRKTT